MDFGTMVHTALLQPEEFPRCYTIMPAFEKDEDNVLKQKNPDGTPKKPKPGGEKQTEYYKRNKATFENMCKSTGASIVTQGDYDAAYETGKKIRSHKVAARFFQRGASSEAVVLWRHDPTGLLCKARFDCLVEGELPTALDVKTTADALPRGFGYSIKKWGYYFQAAFYLSGLRAVGLKHPNFLFLACESKEPYAVIVYECEAETLALGDLHMSNAMALYSQCRERNHWPMYDDAIQPMQLSEWDLKELGQ
jgi:hypothetical protein